MKRLCLLSNLCLLILVLSLRVSAADRADEVRTTEIAFAKAFADRDVKKFFSYLADDAQFLGRSNTMRGKQQVIAVWSEFFKPEAAPFRWQPERVVTNATGDLGFSTGPVFDEAGVQTGTFTSTWDQTARRFLENPLRWRLCLSPDEAIGAVTGIASLSK
jgi:ketosteroid isomerase-like protein